MVHYDTHAGNRRRTWTPLPNYQLGEAVFAPRTGATKEGDGYLMVLGFNGATQKSNFFVLRADDIDAGPVATAHGPIGIPAGFHGSWVPGY